MSKSRYLREHRDCLDAIRAVLKNGESDFTKIFNISGIANRHIGNPKYENEDIDGLSEPSEFQGITSFSVE